MSLEIKYIKKKSEEEEKEAYTDLANNFNNLAIEKGVKYKIIQKGAYFYLSKGTKLWEDYSNQLDLSHKEKFIFKDLLAPEILEEIKPILKELQETVIVEIKSDGESQ